MVKIAEKWSIFLIPIKTSQPQSPGSEVHFLMSHEGQQTVKWQKPREGLVVHKKEMLYLRK